MSLSFTKRQKQIFFWASIALLCAALVGLLGPVLAPFIAAAILAYALNPCVDWLTVKKIGPIQIPRSLAVVMIMVCFLVAISSLFLITVPILQKEIPMLQARIPIVLNNLNAVLTPKLQEFGIDMRWDMESIKKVFAQQFITGGDEILGSILNSVKVGGMVVLGWVATIVLIPVALFYFLLDWHQLVTRLDHAVPRRWEHIALQLTEEVNHLLSQYLRGQLLVMLMLAAYYSVALTIAGFEVAVPVGIITGLLVFIPYLGFGFGLTLALIAAILQFTGWSGVISVAVIYGIGQILEGFLLTPKLVGNRIGLHPLTVIFALLAFGQLLGFVGVLLALPMSAILSVALTHLRTLYLKSSFYNQ